MTIRCIAVDDEPLSLRVIEKYVDKLPQLELVATCTDAFQTMEVLRQQNVELLLLDINMPKLSGISLVRSLDRPPLVVFTTAYSEHAVEGFELEAVDYLLKPFSLERFFKAINRVRDRLLAEPKNVNSGTGHLLVKADKKWYRLNLDDILYLEAFGDYVKIFTKEKMLLTKERLGNLEAQLPDSQFFRIHRSYLISLAALDFVEGNMVAIGKVKLPVSANVKENLLLRLQS